MTCCIHSITESLHTDCLQLLLTAYIQTYILTDMHEHKDAMNCMPGASKDLEKTIQAVQRGTSCNAEAMRAMGIDKIDFGGLAQVCSHHLLPAVLNNALRHGMALHSTCKLRPVSVVTPS